MKSNKILKIISTLFIIMIVFVLIFNRFLIQLKDSIDKFFLPIQSKVYISAEKIIGIKNSMISYKNLISENRKLKMENMELRFENSNFKAIEEENKRLTQILEMRKVYKKNINLKFARVIFRNINNINNKFFIDLGREDGIEKNMIAIYDNCLVGRVVDVQESYSEILMVTSNDSKVSAKTKNNVLGIIQGSDEIEGELYFQPSTTEENIEYGEEIFTSGISEVYPAGLKIGKVSSVNDLKNNLFRNIIVKPDFRSKDLKEVIIYKYDNLLKKKVD